MTYKLMWNSWKKPLAKSSGSKESWKCSKNMHEGPSTKKWDMWVNVDLKKFKENSKSINSVKKLKHGKERFEVLEGVQCANSCWWSKVLGKGNKGFRSTCILFDEPKG
jgi:hypothetical protein